MLNGGMGSVYADNQTAFDVADNGSVTQTGSSTTVNSPGWASSLGSLFTAASGVAQTVTPIIASGTSPAAKAAAPAAGTGSVTSGGSTWMIAAGFLALVAGAFLFFRKKG